MSEQGMDLVESSDGQPNPEMAGALAAQIDDADGGAGAPDERERLDGIVESLLFAAGSPLALRRLVEILRGPSHQEVKAAVGRVSEEYERRRRGIQLVAVAGGFQFRTVAENAEWVRALLRGKPPRLGRAALETLAIVAYRQPATRADIEAIRGVDADSALNSLLSKRLIKITGRKETVGRPLLYSTTPEFLEVLGLKDLNELPALKEIGPVREDDDPAIDEAEAGADWGTTAAEGADQQAEATGAATPPAEDGATPADDAAAGGGGEGAATEDPESRGHQLSSGSGGDDSRGPDHGERSGRNGARDASGSSSGSDQD